MWNRGMSCDKIWAEININMMHDFFLHHKIAIFVFAEDHQLSGPSFSRLHVCGVQKNSLN